MMRGHARSGAKKEERSRTTARVVAARSPDEGVEPSGLAVFDGYVRGARSGTKPCFVQVESGGETVAWIPFVRLEAHRITDLLRTPSLRVLGRFAGPLVRRTIFLVDSGLRAYEYASPLVRVGDVDVTDAWNAAFAALRAEQGVDAIWIAEPTEGAWGPSDGRFDAFPILPMVHVDLAGADSLEVHLGRLSKKRRRNARKERAAFEAAGAVIEEHTAPLAPRLLRDVLACLDASARHSTLHVPYAGLLNDPEVFARQAQTVLVARAGDDVIGFFSLVPCGPHLLQTHGGLDYGLSLEAHAYHNLTYAAIDVAARRGFDRLSLGPLNNETKRRCGTHLRPMVASLWCRRRLDRTLIPRVFVPRLQVYAGASRGGA